MRTILFLLISFNCFAQKVVYPDHLNVTSGWYNEFGAMDENNTSNLTHCYFSSSKYASDVDLIIHSTEPIVSPIFIFTNKGKYCCNIKKREAKKGLKSVYYRSLISLEYFHVDLWKSLDSGIVKIEFYTGKKWYIIRINDNLNKLKNYGTISSE